MTSKMRKRFRLRIDMITEKVELTCAWPKPTVYL